MAMTISGYYDDIELARQVIEALVADGFNRSYIDLGMEYDEAGKPKNAIVTLKAFSVQDASRAEQILQSYTNLEEPTRP